MVERKEIHDLSNDFRCDKNTNTSDIFDRAI